MSVLPPGAASGRTSHPRGLSTLFFTEMWERFSYYGMRALLVLFMVDTARNGLGLDEKLATAIYGLYTAAVYLAALPGGWCGDRLFGPQKAVWYGGILIAAGHFALALPFTNTFYPALLLVVIGTGLLKPNISILVGELYPQGGTARDAGFTLFYMGINLGAFLGPLVCSTLGERLNWHYGFAASGVGMITGLVQYRLSSRRLSQAGLVPVNRFRLNGHHRLLLAGATLAVAAFIALALLGRIPLNPVSIARVTSQILVGGAALYFGGVLLFGKLNGAEKRQVGVICILFVVSAVFWAGFEQAGSSLNLFAERYTQRSLQFLQLTIPAGWFQSLSAVFVISLAPVLAAVWLALARRGIEPSVTVKFAVGLVFLGAGFLVMAGASARIMGAEKPWPTWLIGTYLLHSIGELCLSPVGLSSVTKLAPRSLLGQMMGIWFVATALGNLVAGLLAGQLASSNPAGMAGQFLRLAAIPVALAALLLLLSGWIARLNPCTGPARSCDPPQV